MSASERPTHSATFRAMGTTIEVIGVDISEEDHARGLTTAIRLAEQWEEIFSRFRPESELSRLNRASGSLISVSDDLFWMIELSVNAFCRTGGRFDPTVLPSLVASGYDRDIDLVKARDGATITATGLLPSPGMRGIELDFESQQVRIPSGVLLDLGGIAKGAFVDRLALALMTWPGGCVNAGGDLRVWGHAPNGPDWVTGIENPFSLDEDLAVVSLHDPRACAVATSAVNRRRWNSGGQEHHHLIDPRTGDSAIETLTSCTAFAGSVVEAEISTKSLFVAAAQHVPLDLIDSVAALLVDHDGKLITLKGQTTDALTIFPAETYRQSA